MTAFDLFPETRVDPGLDLDRRYTTRETMDLCKRIARVEEWDLDVAADQESHWAPRWFDVQDNGLEQPWNGRVWCNPPYSDIEPWIEKAWSEASDRLSVTLIAMLLPANRTEQPWWSKRVEPHRDRHMLHSGSFRLDLSSHFLPGRVKYGHPGNREAIGVGSPPFTSVLLLWKRR